ncbi:putative aromatic acid decarboxylase [Rubripirellula lacrimiformis]|uniref:Flavin prenyltransferase UbiX n=1 Tax=Rubripirellula lacrimiformis TaxID=1930273 RepID=A0A517NE30_9BACT|nr:flavin prenyltransferase UbiX [Rubripirellula lacrimiformis]QDT05318.1 putative aromatic acid decarboxylase [Rubripirellula lacrimiformis]
MNDTKLPIVVAITGASGAIYAVRLIQMLCLNDQTIHLAISPSGATVIQQELGLTLDLRNLDLESLVGYVAPWTTSDDIRENAASAAAKAAELVHFHRHDDYMTPIASGSFRTSAMVICPCSGTTLSGIAHASAANLIQRAAEVHLKEHRKLVLVPRETPISVLQIENMHRIAKAGAVVLPAMPGWYQGVETIDDLVDFVVARILDQLDVENGLMRRWGE